MVPPAFTSTCNESKLHISKLQPGLTRAVGQRRDSAVVLIAAAVEDDCLNPLLDRPLADKLADQLRGLDIAAALDLAPSSSLSTVDAETMVWPVESSTTCA